MDRNRKKKGKKGYRPNWNVVLDVPKVPGEKRKRQWISVRGTRKDAEHRLTELLAQVDSGGFIRPTNRTFGEFLAHWLSVYASTHVRPKTLEGYHQRAKRITADLGGILLGELRPDHVQGYLSSMSATLAPGTLVKHYGLIREALGHAVKWGLVTRNVAEVVDAPRPIRKEMRALAPPEVRVLLEACQGTPWYPMIHTLIWTGLRRSELLGLRWKDVDLVMATLRVVQVLHQLQNGTYIYAGPKTAKGRRAVSLSPASCMLLRAHEERQRADSAALGLSLIGDSLVFGHVDGSPRAPATLTHAFTKVARRCGLTGVRLHDLRHTHASILLQQGVHPKVVSERLGHANIQITLDTYSHLLPGMQEAAAAQFDAGMLEALAPTVG